MPKPSELAAQSPATVASLRSVLGVDALEAVVESAAGPTYASIALGEAATTTGQSFAVDNGDGTVSIYLRTGGGSTLQRTLATTGALAATGGAALIGHGAGTVADALNAIPAQKFGSGVTSYRMGTAYGSIDATVNGSYLFDGRSGYPNKLGVNNTKPVDSPTVIARANDTGYIAGAASVASILAGYDNVNNALAGIIASQHSMLYYGADHSAIFGGSLHSVLQGAEYATILGGTNCAIEGAGDYSLIAACDNCKIENGTGITDSGFRSVVLGSSASVAGGRNAFIAGSVSANVQSVYSSVINGESVTLGDGSSHLFAAGNAVTIGDLTPSSYSFGIGQSLSINGARCFAFGASHTIGSGHDYSSAVGTGGITPFAGAHVRSSRQRGSVAGRNQELSFSCSQETTDTTTTRLSTYGASSYPTQPNDSIVSGTVYVTGVNTATGECSTYKIDFSSQRLGPGTPTLRANTTTTLYNGLALPTAPTMNTTTGGIYRVQVVGLASTNIAWHARFVAQQVVYTP